MQKLKKVDFFWINRDQRSFEWFLGMLNRLEEEQSLEELNRSISEGRFMDIHMYFTAALQKTDMRAVGLQLAMDLLHKKVLVLFVKTSCSILLQAGLHTMSVGFANRKCVVFVLAWAR